MLMGLSGDVLVAGRVPDDAFEEMREVFAATHVMFANLEGVHTDRPRPMSNYGGWHLVNGAVGSTASLEVYGKAGFNVLSLANNHLLDAGYEAFLETLAGLKAQGVKTCGAGARLAEAREPAIVTANGIRVAFLAYASIFPMGWEAGADRPGLAPARAYNLTVQHPNYHMPGIPPLLSTVPDQTDLANITDDIRRTRERADLVVVSFHWGDHTQPFRITDHETKTARHCIDAGAHMVIGHHHHLLRGMEWYKGRPIMYGLGDIAFGPLEPIPGLDVQKWFEQQLGESDLGRFFFGQYPSFPRSTSEYAAAADSRPPRIMAWATATRDGVDRIGFLPCGTTSEGRVHPLRLNTPEYDVVVNYLEECNRTQGLKSRIVSDGPTIAGFRTSQLIPE